MRPCLLNEVIALQIWEEDEVSIPDFEYCTNCGAYIPSTWKYCKRCGHPVSDVHAASQYRIAPVHESYTRTVRKRNKHKRGNMIGFAIVILAVIATLSFINPIVLPSSSASQPTSTPITTKSNSTSIPVVTPVIPKTNLTPPNPAPKSVSNPVFLSTSRVMKIPAYKVTCPFTISVPSGSNDYFVYLKYIRTPTNSVSQRERRSSTGTGTDISFYVKSGDSFDTEVPIGVYQLYYTCGETWYGVDERFGSSAPTFKSNDLLAFYDDGEYMCGHTVQLWMQTNGNFDRTSIPASEFPS